MPENRGKTACTEPGDRVCIKWVFWLAYCYVVNDESANIQRGRLSSTVPLANDEASGKAREHLLCGNTLCEGLPSTDVPACIYTQKVF